MQVESQAILDTAAGLDDSFVKVVESIQTVVDKQGKLILAGLGKNAGICQKLVGTFNSIGVSSSFLDPVQAVHGDLGMCQDEDLAFVFSNSGQTREVIELIPLLRRLGVRTVAVTSEKESNLSSICDVVLSYRAEEALSQSTNFSQVMAIYIGLKLERHDGDTRTYSFFRSDGSPYGRLAVDLNSGEIILIDSDNSAAETFAFPRACQAIKKRLSKGELPDEFSYSA